MPWSRFAAVGAVLFLTSCFLPRNGTSDRCFDDSHCATGERCSDGRCVVSRDGAPPGDGGADAGPPFDAGPFDAGPPFDAGSGDAGSGGTPIDFWLILGQNNADGVLDEVPATAPTLPIENVRFYRRTRFESGYVGALDAIDPPDGQSGNGLELSFGADLAASGRSVAIFKFVHRDTTLSLDWTPWGGLDDSSGSNGQNRGLYARMREELQDFDASLRAEGFTPRIAGIIYFQWEGDTASGSLADTYEGHLRRLVTVMREDFGSAPIVLVRAGDGQAFSRRSQIQAAQDAVAATDPQTTIVNTNDLPTGSNGRDFSGDALMTLGSRLATHVAGLTRGTNPLTLPEVDAEPIVHRPSTVDVDGDIGNAVILSAEQAAGLTSGRWSVRVVPGFPSSDGGNYELIDRRLGYENGTWRMFGGAVVTASHIAGQTVDLEVDLTGTPTLTVRVDGAEIGSAEGLNWSITGDIGVGMRSNGRVFVGSIGPFSRP